ncbi:MAG: NapC/NirT family cytochrome c, partial [Bdellovibrionales bacterium]
MKYFWMTLAPLFTFLAPSILGGIAMGVYPGYKAYEYAWKNAQFCTSCHVHDYATVGWKDSIHGDKTTCHDCHHQP